jgi:ABC-type branched-subunit amino acid transport system substrate-binding protein
MKMTKKMFSTIIVFCCLCLVGLPQAIAIDDWFDVSKMGDMSDFDPNNPVIPTGDTIKIAVVASFSGPSAVIGEIYWCSVLWAAHDINKRGGILVDGMKKMVQVIKADHQSNAAIAEEVCERMVLEENVDVLWGTNGSHIMKVINQVAKKYQTIAQCTAALSDELYDAQNFTRHSFMSSFQTSQIGMATAYYYGQIRKQERKFYILCQDYLFGHSMAAGFKKGLNQYYPEAEIVGEDYHELYLDDFTPYLIQIQASGAEVIYTSDWMPDAGNLLIQARQMGVMLPLANVFVDEPSLLHEVGVEGTKGLVHIGAYGSDGEFFKTPDQITYYETWNNLWKTKWTAPYNARMYEHGTGSIGSYVMQTYWLLSVIERAASTDPEKIIKIWEGDTYQYANGKVVQMRSCDHKVVQDLHVEIYVPPEQQKQNFNIPPYYWFTGASYVGPSLLIPREKILPLIDPEMTRCKCECDFEPDGDVDGDDLAEYINDNRGITLKSFAQEFGRPDCF